MVSIGRALQAERLRAVAAAVAAHALHLVAARQRVGIVLQGDGIAHRAAARRHDDQAAFDDARRGCEAGHRSLSTFHCCIGCRLIVSSGNNTVSPAEIVACGPTPPARSR